MDLDVLIENGMIVLPKQGIISGSIGIKNGKIATISRGGSIDYSKEVIDAQNKYIMPGVIDAHVHFGLGSNLEQDFFTETRSAATGGVTTVVTYYRQSEPYDDIFEEIKSIGEERACIDFSLHLGISSEKHIANIPKYVEKFGVSSYKFLMAYKGEDARKMGSAEMTDGLFYDALSLIKDIKGVVPCVHAENIELIWSIRKKILEQGRNDPAAWVDSRPDFTESEYVRRALFLAEITECPLYIVHTTCKKALQDTKAASERQKNIYVETCPVYLTHTKDSMQDNVLKVSPPVRDQADIEALWEGIENGSVQTVGSDHLALKRESKKGSIWEASMGVSGTATILPILLSEGYHKRSISLERIAEITAYNPAKIFNLSPQKGNIMVGSDADLTIVDLEKEKRMSHSILNSSSDFCIYENWRVKGWPVLTMVRGNVIMKEGQIVAKEGFGKYIRREPR
jgi:dihydropyrimidinase